MAKRKRDPVNPLIAWRKRHKLSQRQAVLILGCSRQAFIGWERGDKATPKYILLATLAIDHGLHDND